MVCFTPRKFKNAQEFCINCFNLLKHTDNRKTLNEIVKKNVVEMQRKLGNIKMYKLDLKENLSKYVQI